MRKIMLAGMVVMLVLCMIGCNGNIGGQVNDLVEQNEMNSSGADENNSGAVSGGGDSAAGDGWPSELSGIPEFVYGEISKVQKLSEEYDGIEYVAYNIDFKSIQKGAGEKYAGDLSGVGFEESQEPYSYESSISGKTVTEYGYDKYAFETEDTNYSIQVDYWTDDSNIGSVYVSIPLKPEGGVVMNNEENDDVAGNNEEDANAAEGENEENAGNGSEYNWDTLSGGAIPDDYPHGSVPIVQFSSSVILGTDRQEMGGMGVSYVIIFGIDEDVDVVSGKIRDELKQYIVNAGGTFQSITNQMFMGETDDCQYTIAIGDGTADGYKTIVDYTVIQQ